MSFRRLLVTLGLIAAIALPAAAQQGTTEIQQFPVEDLVFIDEQRMGGLATMRGLPVENVREIRYVAARDATTRWGTGYTAGVILIVTTVR